MEKPFETESPGRTRERLIYHQAQLLGEERPEVVALAAPIGAHLAQYDAHLQQRQQHADEVTRAMAVRDRRNRKADRFLGGFDLALLALVGRDRKDARFLVAYQGRNLSTVQRLPILDQAEAMQQTAEALDRPELSALKDAWQAGLRDHAAALRQAHEALQAILQQRDALGAQAILLRLGAQRLLERSYADLLAIFPHERDAAEDFFVSFGGSRG